MHKTVAQFSKINNTEFKLIIASSFLFKKNKDPKKNNEAVKSDLDWKFLQYKIIKKQKKI